MFQIILTHVGLAFLGLSWLPRLPRMPGLSRMPVLLGRLLLLVLLLWLMILLLLLVKLLQNVSSDFIFVTKQLALKQVGVEKSWR